MREAGALVKDARREIENHRQATLNRIKNVREEMAEEAQAKPRFLQVVKEIDEALRMEEPCEVRVSIYHNSVAIRCDSPAKGSKIVHLLIEKCPSIVTFWKEMEGRYNDEPSWCYVTKIPTDPGKQAEVGPGFYGDYFRIDVSPSYPNPECVPRQEVNQSCYKSWVCDRKAA